MVIIIEVYITFFLPRQVPPIIQSKFPGKQIVLRIDQKQGKNCPKMPKAFTL